MEEDRRLDAPEKGLKPGRGRSAEKDRIMRELTLSCIEQVTGGKLHVGYRAADGTFREVKPLSGTADASGQPDLDAAQNAPGPEMTGAAPGQADGGAVREGQMALALCREEVSSIVTDSRKAAEGSLFCAIVGARVDGHSFIPKVFDQGALCVLSERELTEADLFSEAASCSGRSAWRAFIVVPSSTEEALGKIAARYLDAMKVPVVGITGSVGKTSTKEAIASVLGTHFRTLKTEGNFNNALGLPLTVFRLTEEDQIAVLEMGISHFGDMKPLGQIARPDTAVITNIGNCHLEYLGDRDGVLKEKSSLLGYLKEGGHAVLNGNDDKLRSLSALPSHLWFGIRSDELPPEGIGAGTFVEYPGDLDPDRCVWAQDIVPGGIEGTEAVLRTPQGSVKVTIPVPGLVNVQNAAAAAAVGLIHGLSLQEIADGIGRIETIGGRFRVVNSPSGAAIIDDCYNANPMSMKSSLSILRGSRGRRIAILGDMGELGSDEVKLHREVGAYAADCVDQLIVIGKLAEEILDEAREKRPDLAGAWYPSTDAYLASDDAGFHEGDTVLVKASHFMQFGKIVEALSS